MSSKSYFRFVSTVTIVINLCVGIGALYLIERIVPAIDEILNENAYSVSSVIKMQGSLLNSQISESRQESEKLFWESFENAKSNITIEGESEIISEIYNLGLSYWKADQTVLFQLSQKLVALSDLNLKAMNKKNRTAKIIGLAGAWALGFLVLMALVLQLSLRKKMFDSFIQPTLSLINVISDYGLGNYQRRYTSTHEAAREIKYTGDVLNKILDENLTARSK